MALAWREMDEEQRLLILLCTFLIFWWLPMLGYLAKLLQWWATVHSRSKLRNAGLQCREVTANMKRLVQCYKQHWDDDNGPTHSYTFFAWYTFSSGDTMVTVKEHKVDLPTGLALQSTHCSEEASKDVRVSRTWPVVCLASDPSVHMLKHENGINGSESRGGDDDCCGIVLFGGLWLLSQAFAACLANSLFVAPYCSSADEARQFSCLHLQMFLLLLAAASLLSVCCCHCCGARVHTKKITPEWLTPERLRATRALV